MSARQRRTGRAIRARRSSEATTADLCALAATRGPDGVAMLDIGYVETASPARRDSVRPMIQVAFRGGREIAWLDRERWRAEFAAGKVHRGPVLALYPELRSPPRDGKPHSLRAPRLSRTGRPVPFLAI